MRFSRLPQWGIVLACLASAPQALAANDLAPHRVGDATAAVVTEQKLLASERFWPYHVALTTAFRSAKGQTLAAGTSGVLIRVEVSGAARIDFGRDGLHEVPVSATDLVERADRIRAGELDKMAPNFALALGPRLVDSAAETLRPYRYGDVLEHGGFLTVFADPRAESLADLAGALQSWSERRGVLTILVPQGEIPDAEVRERLRSLAWTVPFVYDHLADAYTRTLLPEGSTPPAVMLQTNEGRVLYQSVWRAGVAAELAAVSDEAFAVLPGAGASHDQHTGSPRPGTPAAR